MKVVLVVLSLCLAVLGQIPTPCTSPAQWEGRERVTERGKNFEEWHKLYYDGSTGRERNVGEIEEGSTRDYIDILSLYAENKRYTLNMKTRQCNVTKIDRPFRHRGVPPNAQFSSTFTLGATGIAGEYVTVQSFTANITFGTFHEEYFGLVTSPGCVPITNWYYNQPENRLDMVNYFDITIGISDPMAFIPPKECM